VKLKVQNAPNLERDTRSNGIVSTDTESYLRLMQKRKEQREAKERLDRLELEVSDMKTMQVQTNVLLQNLINKINN
jgi:RNase P/RNase MRP subunit p29